MNGLVCLFLIIAVSGVVGYITWLSRPVCGKCPACPACPKCSPRLEWRLIGGASKTENSRADYLLLNAIDNAKNVYMLLPASVDKKNERPWWVVSGTEINQKEQVVPARQLQRGNPGQVQLFANVAPTNFYVKLS